MVLLQEVKTSVVLMGHQWLDDWKVVCLEARDAADHWLCVGCLLVDCSMITFLAQVK